MKKYIISFFTYFGCTLQQDGDILVVELSSELTSYFGKPVLRLVFNPEHIEKNTELVTYGSYLANRIYDLIKHFGKKLSITLPKKQKAVSSKQKAGNRGVLPSPSSQEGKQAAGKAQGSVTLCGNRKIENTLLPFEIVPHHCSIKKRRSREVHKTEAFITFRVTYFSNEKVEELVNTGVDIEGNVVGNIDFPYTSGVLKDAVLSRFPFTRKQAKEIYDKCLRQVNTQAEQNALRCQEKLAKQYHQDVTRLEGYYQQMIDEIPDLAKDRETTIRQLQQEYEIKTTEELKKCHVQVAIEPLSFCTVSIPFQRYRYTLETERKNGKDLKTTVDMFHNLFSGTVLYPRCESCGKEMKELGICQANSHPVCLDCLVECHRCHTPVCRDCGIEQCAECEEWVCRQCSEDCHLCGKRYCAEHLLGCVKCRDHFCQQCASQCDQCGKITGKIHFTECDISHHQVCLDCIVLCSCCAQKVSQSYVSSCAYCGQQACLECTFSCDVCGTAFCVHHMTECEISGKMLCPHHSGICHNCSQQVSTRYLHTCDICGAQICAHCVVQCHGCNIFFCKEHAGEMTKCPECGKLYCSLCYSGQGVCVSCQKAVISKP